MIVAELRRTAEKAITLATDGDVAGGKAAITEGQTSIGLKTVSTIQGRITTGLSPPLSDRTVYARLHRKKNRRSGPDMKPLIDTGSFLLLSPTSSEIDLNEGRMSHEVLRNY